MAMASSSLNPNAPLFIPAAYRQVEDFSPEWWELVHTTAWFRDRWFHQHQLHEAQHDAALAALPDDLLDTDDLFYSPDHHHQQQQLPQDTSDAALLRTLASAPSPWEQQPQIRHADKPAQHVGLIKGAARRGIHQPR